MASCSRCGHETAGRRRIRPDLCGPCVLPHIGLGPAKPIGWWDAPYPWEGESDES